MQQLQQQLAALAAALDLSHEELLSGAAAAMSNGGVPGTATTRRAGGDVGQRTGALPPPGGTRHDSGALAAAAAAAKDLATGATLRAAGAHAAERSRGTREAAEAAAGSTETSGVFGRLSSGVSHYDEANALLHFADDAEEERFPSPPLSAAADYVPPLTHWILHSLRDPLLHTDPCTLHPGSIQNPHPCSWVSLALRTAHFYSVIVRPALCHLQWLNTDLLHILSPACRPCAESLRTFPRSLQPWNKPRWIARMRLRSLQRQKRSSFSRREFRHPLPHEEFVENLLSVQWRWFVPGKVC